MTGNPTSVCVTLYSRNWCHLCDDMRGALEALREEFSFEVDVVDIDAEPALEAKYNELVPVLEWNGRELCRYQLDAQKVRLFLNGMAQRKSITEVFDEGP